MDPLRKFIEGSLSIKRAARLKKAHIKYSDSRTGFNSDSSKKAASTYSRYEDIVKKKALKRKAMTMGEGIVKKANKAKKNAIEIKAGMPRAKYGEVDPTNRNLKAFDKDGFKGVAKAITRVKRGSNFDPGPRRESLVSKIVKRLRENAEVKPTHISRKAAMGSNLAGYYDKKGKPAKQKFGSDKLKNMIASQRGGVKKPLPLNLKGKPKGNRPVNPDKVRGKSINTSRGSGQEGMKADKNTDAFNKLIANLSNRN